MAETFSFRMHKALKAEIGRIADTEQVSMNDVIHRILAEGVGRPDLARVPKKPVGRKRNPAAAVA